MMPYLCSEFLLAEVQHRRQADDQPSADAILETRASNARHLLMGDELMEKVKFLNGNPTMVMLCRQPYARFKPRHPLASGLIPHVSSVQHI